MWQRLTAGRRGGGRGPTGGALAQTRRRVGAEPLHRLFDLLRGPAAGIGTAGVWWRGLLVCAIDGTTMAVPGESGGVHQAPLGLGQMLGPGR
ncbi:hypothetical protein [Streptomyces sp. NBC_00076]|uniref:hypothetical protein n=1 Tax=Streptomyces sp. NBC_00076 TaxID=2975642 RepID=UPI003254A97D